MAKKFLSTGDGSERTCANTGLLKAWSGGDSAALERLTPLVYDQLRRMARRYMRQERAGNTLQTTALVNEAYLRLVDAQNVSWQDRVYLFAVSVQGYQLSAAPGTNVLT